jgi:hypothetical protein
MGYKPENTALEGVIIEMKATLIAWKKQFKLLFYQESGCIISSSWNITIYFSSHSEIVNWKCSFAGTGGFLRIYLKLWPG